MLRIRARRVANLTWLPTSLSEAVNSFAMSVCGKSSKQGQIMSRIIIFVLEAEHHEVAVIAAQGVSQRRRR
jgi:hypothetical protein